MSRRRISAPPAESWCSSWCSGNTNMAQLISIFNPNLVGLVNKDEKIGSLTSTFHALGQKVDPGQHARKGETVRPQSTSESSHVPFLRSANPDILSDIVHVLGCGGVEREIERCRGPEAHSS